MTTRTGDRHLRRVCGGRFWGPSPPPAGAAALRGRMASASIYVAGRPAPSRGRRRHSRLPGEVPERGRPAVRGNGGRASPTQPLRQRPFRVGSAPLLGRAACGASGPGRAPPSRAPHTQTLRAVGGTLGSSWS